MSYDIKRFYRALDEHYDAHDNYATEAFLKDERMKAWEEGASIPANEGCPSCVPELKPDMGFVCVCNEQGCFYRGLGRFDEALESFRAALGEMEHLWATDDPEYGVVLLNLAGVYRMMGRPQDALDTFQKARKLLEGKENVPLATLAGLYNNIGLVYLDLSEPKDAEELFRRALELLEGSEEQLSGLLTELGTTWCNIASAQQAQGQLEPALDSADKAEQVFILADGGQGAHFAALLDLRGVLLYRLGRYAEALEVFQRALERTELVYGRNTEYATGCLNCCACCVRLERQDEARRWKALADELNGAQKA